MRQTDIIANETHTLLSQDATTIVLLSSITSQDDNV